MINKFLTTPANERIKKGTLANKLMVLENYTPVDEKAINNLAKNYNTLDYYVKLVADLKRVYPTEHFETFSKHELHKLLNDVLVQYYNGEEILKYKLAEKHLKQRNIVGAFEMKVNNSRVDFLAINGVSTSYEIKSELDNLSKLSKQTSDYLLAFEYNYLVTDAKHICKAKKILPDSFGLWSCEKGKYRKLKEANLNRKIDAEIQLRLLTKKELRTNYPEQVGKINKILKDCTAKEINMLFKNILKQRYKKRWSFVVSNREIIFPIDFQFFFNNNIDPNHIYF